MLLLTPQKPHTSAKPGSVQLRRPAYSSGKLSDGGAVLDIASVIGIPKRFTLKIDGEPSRPLSFVRLGSGGSYDGRRLIAFSDGNAPSHSPLSKHNRGCTRVIGNEAQALILKGPAQRSSNIQAYDKLAGFEPDDPQGRDPHPAGQIILGPAQQPASRDALTRSQHSL